MRIGIHTLGTRGDVQPYLALALGLKAAGHEVQIAAPTQFEAFIGARGIPFAHLPGEFLELLETPEARGAMAGGPGFSAGFRLLKQFRPICRRLLTAEWEAAKHFEPETVIYHPKAIGAPHIAEKLGCQSILASPSPGYTPTKAFASPLLPFRSAGPLNRTTHSVMASSGDVLFRSMISEWRATELNLPSRPTRSLKPHATLYAYSARVVPVPDDWPANLEVTGYWFLDDATGWQPGESLSAFLSEGEPPIYVGFGSIPGIDPVKLTALVLEALSKTGKRGILATGGGPLQPNTRINSAYLIDAAPHDKLLSHVSACVHHGGAGTTAAALRAGKPSVTCPFFGDQPFWARRLHELGAGPAPLNRKILSSDTLAAAIVEATQDSRILSQSAVLGMMLNAESGVENAVTFINAMSADRDREDGDLGQTSTTERSGTLG